MVVSCMLMEQSVFLNFQFIFVMLAVKLRYKLINSFLEEKFLTLPIKDVKDGNQKLNAAALIHDKLVDITNIINRCYGVPVSILKQVIKINQNSNFFKDDGDDWK